jgi:PAS domain S-box-containing protein
MLRKPSRQVQRCFDRAFDARRRAEGTADLARRADYLEMEKRWLALAQSYEFTERLSDFNAVATDWRRRFDEWRRAREKPGEASRLQKILQDANVDALFERMWLASIVEFSDDAIISRNVDGIILSWNKGAERLFGHLAEEAIGKPLSITVPPGREGEYYAILERAQRGVQHYEIVRQRKDGSLIDISLTVSPIGGAGGKVIGVSNIARDISERKRSEAHISTLTREAEHRAKNLLANVKAMIRLSQSDTLETFKEVIEGRIEALANVHSLFAQSRWTGAELDYLHLKI